MSTSEQKGFVFAVTFIMIFSLFLSTLPADFQGADEDAEMITPVDPVLLSGFAETENYSKSAFSGIPTPYYDYELGNYYWRSWYYNTDQFFVTRKVLWFGLWLGATLVADFINEDGENRDASLSWSEIESDAINGTHRYNLVLENGDSAGGFIVFWNKTLYSAPKTAWDADELHLIHGLGLSDSATNNIGNLIIGLLFLQIPDVPVLLNALIVFPIWANIVYVLWFIIKEMIPFV